MLEVHAILHRQRCYENMTEKTGTLSDAYFFIIMNTKKIIGISLLSLCITFFMSCSDDDTPNDPADTITLNMLNEHNGKTYLGESGTYIVSIR